MQNPLKMLRSSECVRVEAYEGVQTFMRNYYISYKQTKQHINKKAKMKQQMFGWKCSNLSLKFVR